MKAVMFTTRKLIISFTLGLRGRRERGKLESNELWSSTSNPGPSSHGFTLHIMFMTRRFSKSNGSGLADLTLSMTSGLAAICRGRIG